MFCVGQYLTEIIIEDTYFAWVVNGCIDDRINVYRNGESTAIQDKVFHFFLLQNIF